MMGVENKDISRSLAADEGRPEERPTRQIEGRRSLALQDHPGVFVREGEFEDRRGLDREAGSIGA